MGWRRAGTGLLLAFVLASCGVSGGSTGSDRHHRDAPVSTTTSTSPVKRGSDANTGWLAADGQGAIFIAYTRSAGFLSGSLQISRLTLDGDRWTVTGNSQAFSGSLDGDDLALTVGSAAPWFGTLKKDELTLNVPQKDGSLSPVVLMPGSVADYNGAVDGLKQSAASRNSAADAEAEQAQLEREAAAAMATFESRVSSVASAGDDASSVDYSDDLSGYESDWQALQDDVGEMKSADCADMSSMAGYVDSDRGYLDSDRGYVESTDGYADDATQRVESAISDATAALQVARSSSDAAGTAAPDSSARDGAEADARTALQSMNDRRSAAHARADEIDAAATALNEQAQAYASAHSC